jgi:alkylation response protein AidB-like acyl-CoA dehydrogenase
MDFDLTNDQKMLQDEVRKFAQTELVPVAPEIDESGEFPLLCRKSMVVQDLIIFLWLLQ